MRNYVWMVEEEWRKGEWLGWGDRVRPTRADARRLQRYVKKEDGLDAVPSRIRKYVRVEEK
jgi:hypothetical protein